MTSATPIECLTPDLEAAHQFIELLTGSRDAAVTFHPVDGDTDRRKQYQHMHGTLDQCAARLCELNRDGVGVFVMVNEGDGLTRKAENVKVVRAVFMDFDDTSIDPLKRIEESGFDPDFIVESSLGKFHAYRRVDGFPVDKALFKGAQVTLARAWGADDKINDLSRIMRLPGFVHRKVRNGAASEPFLTRLHEVGHPGRSTLFADLLAEFNWTTETLKLAGGAKADKAPALASASAAVLGAKPADPFRVRLRDGEGRNNHAMHLAGICAASGLSLELSQQKCAAWNANNIEPLPAETVSELVGRIWQKEHDKIKGFPLTEMGLAQRLTNRYGNDFRYVSDIARWIAWDGRTWCFDTGGLLIQEACKTMARSLIEEARNESDDQRRTDLLKLNLQAETAKKVSATITLAQSDPNIQVSSCQLDSRHYMLAVDNGAIDLQTGELRAHNRELLLTQRAFVTYDTEAVCPRWLQFINEVTCGDVELADYLQRVCGYCLTGDTSEQVMLIFVGEGSNGKSVLVRILEEIMGGYSTRLPACSLMVRRSDGPRNDIAMLRAARLVPISEPARGQQLDEALVKDLVSQDTITARFLNKEFFKFLPTQKILMATNHLPTIAGSDEGIWRRMRVLPFDAKFEGDRKDPHLIQKLKREEPGILNWLIEGCIRWRRQGLATPASVQKKTGQYREDLNIVGRFIAEACIRAEPEDAAAMYVPARTLYSTYQHFCKSHGLPYTSERFFGEDISKIFPRKKMKQSRSYGGLAVRQEWVPMPLWDELVKRHGGTDEARKREGIADLGIAL